MKKIILVTALTVVFPFIAQAGGVKESIKSVVSDVVSSGKDAISGIKDGISEGRKSGESADGAIVVNDKQALKKNLQVSVSSVEKISNTEYKVTLVLRNSTDKIVRLTDLHENKSLQLLDKDGFVSYQKSLTGAIESDVTVPEKAATRVRYNFSEVEGVPATLRLYGMEIALPEVTK